MLTLSPVGFRLTFSAHEIPTTSIKCFYAREKDNGGGGEELGGGVEKKKKKYLQRLQNQPYYLYARPTYAVLVRVLRFGKNAA